MCRLKKNLQPCQCTKFQHNMAHAKVLCMVQMELCIDSLRQGDLLVVHILVNVENKEDDYYPGTTLDMTFNETGLLAKKLQLWLTVSLCVMSFCRMKIFLKGKSCQISIRYSFCLHLFIELFDCTQYIVNT